MTSIPDVIESVWFSKSCQGLHKTLTRVTIHLIVKRTSQYFSRLIFAQKYISPQPVNQLFSIPFVAYQTSGELAGPLPAICSWVFTRLVTEKLPAPLLQCLPSLFMHKFTLSNASVFQDLLRVSAIILQGNSIDGYPGTDYGLEWRSNQEISILGRSICVVWMFVTWLWLCLSDIQFSVGKTYSSKDHIMCLRSSGRFQVSRPKCRRWASSQVKRKSGDWSNESGKLMSIQRS